MHRTGALGPLPPGDAGLEAVLMSADMARSREGGGPIECVRTPSRGAISSMPARSAESADQAELARLSAWGGGQSALSRRRPDNPSVRSRE